MADLEQHHMESVIQGEKCNYIYMTITNRLLPLKKALYNQMSFSAPVILNGCYA